MRGPKGWAHNPASDPIAKIQAGIRDFLSKRPTSDDPTEITGFVKENENSLFVRYGPEEFTLCPLTKDSAPPEPAKNGVYTVEELLALDLPAPEPLIDGLLYEGETIVIAGRQKVGKSRLIQQAALCLANGEPFLGMRVPACCRVLMIDLENRLGPLSQRFKAMGGTRNGDRSLLLWCAQTLASDLPDASPAGAERLRALVEIYRPDVLMIDPWRLWLAADENDASEIVRGLKTLGGIRETRPNMGIVIVHHVRKEKFESPRRLLADPSLWAEAVSGHHALTSHVDACFGLERQLDESENPLIVFGGIARNTEPRTLILDEDESLRFQVAAHESAAMQVMTPAQQKIWNKAKKLKRFRFNQLADETKNRKAITGTLTVAESHGLLRKDGVFYVVDQVR